MYSLTVKSFVIYLFVISLSSCGGGDTKESSSTSTSENNSALSHQTLSKPEIVSLSQLEDSLLVYWDDSNAVSYRIIYWQEGDIPDFASTNDTEFISPNLSSGEYTVIVEAYDPMGNSFFSDPTKINVF